MLSEAQGLSGLLETVGLPRDVSTLIGRTFQFSFIDDTDHSLMGFFFGTVRAVVCLPKSGRSAIQLYFDLTPSVVGTSVTDLLYDRAQGSWCVRMRTGDALAREVPGKLIIF